MKTPKLLIITRLYSALESSIFEGQWHPKGMPTFVKFLEGLEKRGIKFDIIFLDKTGALGLHNVNTISLNEFTGRIYIVPSSKIVHGIRKLKGIRRSRDLIQSIFHLLCCLKIYNKDSYSKIYVDRANIFIGAYFSWVKRKIVFLRLHGILDMFKIFRSPFGKLYSPIKYLSFFAPFEYILCTEDGSPGKYFLENFRNTKTKYKVLLNGVDKTNISSDQKKNIKRKLNILRDYPIILFVSRLEDGKGVMEFVDSITILSKERQDFYALIIGNGSYFMQIQSKIKGLKNVFCIGFVTHIMMPAYYQISDIYVSLNSYGNLSNTVLEALQAGNSIITLKKDEENYRDLSTGNYLSDTAIFVDRDDLVSGLVTELNLLLNSKEKLWDIKKKSKKKAKALLKTWDERINEEIELLLK